MFLCHQNTKVKNINLLRNFNLFLNVILTKLGHLLRTRLSIISLYIPLFY